MQSISRDGCGIQNMVEVIQFDNVCKLAEDFFLEDITTHMIFQLEQFDIEFNEIQRFEYTSTSTDLYQLRK